MITNFFKACLFLVLVSFVLSARSSQNETLIITAQSGLNFRSNQNLNSFVRPFKAIPNGWQVKRLDGPTKTKVIGDVSYEFIQVEFCPHSPTSCESGYVANEPSLIQPSRLVADKIKSIKAIPNRGGVKGFAENAQNPNQFCSFDESVKMNISERLDNGWIKVSIPASQDGIDQSCRHLQSDDSGENYIAIVYPNQNFVEFSEREFSPEATTEASTRDLCEDDCNTPINEDLIAVEGQAAELAQIASVGAADFQFKVSDATTDALRTVSEALDTAAELADDAAESGTELYERGQQAVAERQREQARELLASLNDSASEATSDVVQIASRTTEFSASLLPNVSIDVPSRRTYAVGNVDLEATSGETTSGEATSNSVVTKPTATPSFDFSSIDFSIPGFKPVDREVVDLSSAEGDDLPEYITSYLFPVRRHGGVIVQGKSFTKHPWQYKPGSPFGKRVHPISNNLKDHIGVDMRTLSGTPLYPARNGVIVKSRTEGRYGWRIEICHYPTTGNVTADNCVAKTTYSHLANSGTTENMNNVNCSRTPTVGTHVNVHQQIGCTGSSGRVTGPHLHFEIIENGVPKEPWPSHDLLKPYENYAGTLDTLQFNVLPVNGLPESEFQTVNIEEDGPYGG